MWRDIKELFVPMFVCFSVCLLPAAAIVATVWGILAAVKWYLH